MLGIPWIRYLFVVLLTSSDSIAYILIPPYLQERQFDYALIGLLVGITGIASLGSRFPSGFIYRRGRAHWLTTAALALVGAAFLAYPLAEHVALIALALAAIGLGSGVATTVNMAMFMDAMPTGADKHRAMALYASAISFGHMLGNLIGGTAADAWGYLGSFQLAAGTTFLAILVLWLDRIPASASEPSSARRARAASVTSRQERVVALLRLMAEPKMVAIAMVAFLLNFLHGIVTTFFPLYGISVGMSLAEVGILKSAHSLTNTLARPVAGEPIRWLGAERASFLCLAILAGLITLLPGQSHFWVFVILMAAFGLMRAIVMVANTVAMADMDERRISRGTASGFYHSSKDLGSLASPTICGAVASAFGLATMLVAAPIAAAAAFFGVVAVLNRRKLPTLETAAEPGR